MYNKQVLSEALANLQKRKARLTQPKDIIVDPMGQYNHPGEITRIPGGDITMANVPYPVMAYPNVGQPQMMYPEQDYNFPGADYVDEVPIMPKAQSGRNVRYTDNPNDPGIKAYADSLNAYNMAAKLPEEWERDDLKYFNDKYANNKGTIIRALLYPGSTLHHPLHYDSDGKPVSPFENKISGVKPYAIGRSTLYKDDKIVTSPSGVSAIVEYPVFKKPVQPVKYRDPKVVAKQQQLIDAGYDIGGADGIWGKKSQAAWDEMNAPVKEKSVETSFKEEQVPITPREQRPTGLTKQVPKTEQVWSNSLQMYVPVTRAGNNATVEYTGTDIGGRKLKYGGLAPGAAFQDGDFIDIELTDEQIDEYRRGGYIVEEYAIGGEGGGDPEEPKPVFKKDEKFYDEARELEEGLKLYKSYKEELLKLKRLKEKEEQDVINKRQNILNIAQSLTENPRPTRTNLDYIAPSDYYCNTRSCEIFQDAGLTIPEGTEPFTVNKKVYKPGDKVPIIPGNMQMKGVLKNLGFLPVDESNLKPGDLAQEEIYKSQDYQGNTFSPRFVPSHSMIKANKDYYNAPGGDRTDYKITPISFHGEKGKDWRIQGYRYEGALPYYNNLLKDVQSKLEQYSQYADIPVEQLPIKRDAYLLNILSKVPESILPSSTVDWQNKRKEEIKNSELSNRQKRKLYKNFKQQGGIVLELDENQIQKYLDDGYIVEEL